MRRDLRRPALGPLMVPAAVCMLAARLACAQALADSRDPAEAAPAVRLGPPVVVGAQVMPSATWVELADSLRSATITAEWLIDGPPGPIVVSLPSTLFQITWQTPGVTPIDINETKEELPIQDVRIDPGDGDIYYRGYVISDTGGPPLRRYMHTVSVLIPPDGHLVLRAAVVGSAGFDRTRRPRRGTELAHALHRRPDFFVYQFAVIGPTGRVTLLRPPRTTAAYCHDNGVLHIAATAARPLPLGLTMSLGLAVGTADGHGETVTQGLVRAAVDLLLPYGHALSLSGEIGSAFVSHQRVTGALLYQIYSRWPAFYPIAAHLDLGPVVDLWSSSRAGVSGGGRLTAGLHLSAVGFSAGLDVVAPQYAEITELGPSLRYRVNLMVSIGL